MVSAEQMIGLLKGCIADGDQRTEFVPPNFFSVEMSAPCRLAALRADSPRMTFSFWTLAPGPRALLPILVTVSQSPSLIFVVDG